MNKVPEIRIQFSYLLEDTISSQLDKLYNPDHSKLSSYDNAEKYADEYKKAWSQYDKKILESLKNRLKLDFYKPVIDVYLADYIIPMSQPLIIHFRNEPDQFVDVLTHELIHVLLTDNQYYQEARDGLDLTNEWKKIFKIDDFKTLIHIPVHAILKYIYLDVLKEPERLKRDIDHSISLKNGKAYVDSWNYVEKHDYNQIIDQTFNSYKK